MYGLWDANLIVRTNLVIYTRHDRVDALAPSEAIRYYRGRACRQARRTMARNSILAKAYSSVAAFSKFEPLCVTRAHRDHNSPSLKEPPKKKQNHDGISIACSKQKQHQKYSTCTHIAHETIQRRWRPPSCSLFVFNRTFHQAYIQHNKCRCKHGTAR